MLTDDERRRAVGLAIGRLFSLTLRPSKPGDVEQYEVWRRVILECAPEVHPDYTPSYVRDRNKGAAGD